MKKDNKKNKNKKQDGLYAVLVFSICILIVFMIVYQLKMKQKEDDKTLAYTDLIKQISIGNVKKVEMVTGSTTVKVTLKEKLEEKGMECCHCHQKATPRSEKERKQLQNRLSRMSGQLNGISRMLEENRYCGDILTQVAAVESALQAFGYAILKEHMETCVVEEIRKGNTAIVDEAVELVKKLK